MQHQQCLGAYVPAGSAVNDRNLTGAVILVANLAILGLSLKLYTEYVKGWAMDNRARP